MGRQPRRGRRVRPRRDFEALTARRMQAAEMFARGKRQVDVVTELGVSAQTASRRLWTPSLAYRWRMWVLTVLSERNSSLAISGRVSCVGR